ncbi:sensor histidine kinase [Niabella beijingensis]|uniref:sensor histidine kinase n=1 Tax=Niabella beijingensis TaxID=2872700 RepID=UPI001CBC98E3|nr:HAMP domain-containing sensor histidine kinase [Niabella beijingensis]MBZ4192561.1 HAMP domain-containing histidine kinase [Niabella beijingensis]
MIIAFLVLTGFQIWWLQTNYTNEKSTFNIKTASTFNELVRETEDSIVQTAIARQFPEFKKFSTTAMPAGRFPEHTVAVPRMFFTQRKEADAEPGKRAAGNILVRYGSKDSLYEAAGTVAPAAPPVELHQMGATMNSVDMDNGTETEGHTFRKGVRVLSTRMAPLVSGVTGVAIGRAPDKRTGDFHFAFADSTGKMVSLKLDSLLAYPFDLKRLSRAYAARLRQMKVNTSFAIRPVAADKYHDTTMISALSGNTLYLLSFPNATAFLYKTIALPITFSVFLIALTGITFVLLYRGLQKQRKLTAIKNEFISNMTHELKTPIATVGVAIEALKNFSAIDNPQKREEYLEASQKELHRLSLLVDKVMRLSLIDKKGIQLNKAPLNLSEVVAEVTRSMRLQLERKQAVVSVSGTKEVPVYADRMHLESVVFNLLDNALKYSKGHPVIKIDLQKQARGAQLSVSDNGIGIPPEYRQKVFEKFFRVPHGDTHNAKGYGLGLNYVWQVVKQHGGTTTLYSKPGETIFVITIG